MVEALFFILIMTELLEDIIHTLNSLPNRKVRGTDYTTYDLVKRVEEKLKELELELKVENFRQR